MATKDKQACTGEVPRVVPADVLQGNASADGLQAGQEVRIRATVDHLDEDGREVWLRVQWAEQETVHLRAFGLPPALVEPLGHPVAPLDASRCPRIVAGAVVTGWVRTRIVVERIDRARKQARCHWYDADGKGCAGWFRLADLGLP